MDSTARDERSHGAVRLNDFARQWQLVAEGASRAVAEVGSGGWYVLGVAVESFERALAVRWPMPFAVGVGNGLDALEISLRCAGVGSDARVLTTPLTAFATTLAILRAGGRPVYVDVDESGLLDLRRVAELARRGQAPKFLLPVHLFGHAMNLAELRSLSEREGLIVVEDCAQSIGATSGERPTGSVGLVSATSFYPTKNLGALGDGGAVLTSDESIARRARELRNYGQTGQYVHDFVGLNSRLDEMHAAILLRAMLPELGRWTEARARTARSYRAGIDNGHLRIPPTPAESRSNGHLFPILTDEGQRESFRRFLASRGIESAVHYPRLATEQRALSDAGRVEVLSELPIATRFARTEVSLPIHPLLAEIEVARVIDACNEWRPS